MRDKYFSSLLPELSIRAARATVSRLGFSNPSLRSHLTQLFSSSLGEPGCFVGEPVFEATFGWESTDVTLGSLESSMLTKKLISALDQPWGMHHRHIALRNQLDPTSINSRHGEYWGGLNRSQSL